MRIVFSVLLALICPVAEASPGFRCEPFNPGEKTVFALTYFGATAGTAEISAEYTAKQWKLGVLAKTDPVFSLFYRVENKYESLVPAPDFSPSSMRATINESRQSGTTTQEFDRKKKSARFLDHRQDKKRGEILRDETFIVPEGTVDVISALFSLRRSALAMGQEVKIPVLIGREVSELVLKVEDQENLPTKIGSIDSWILKASVFKDGAAKAVPETQMWIAKSGPRQILKIKAKIKIGSVIAYLRSYSPAEVPAECPSLGKPTVGPLPKPAN